MKVLHYFLSGLAVELLEPVHLGESLNPDAVEWVDLPLHELAAGVADSVHLEQAGGLKEQLHALRGDPQRSAVAVVDHRFHRRGIHVENGNGLHVGLGEVARKHGAEVRAGSG